MKVAIKAFYDWGSEADVGDSLAVQQWLLVT